MTPSSHANGWLVVGSTAAGSSDEQLVESVAGGLARSAPTELAITTSPTELDGVLRRHGGRTVVVVGGDGSAHVAINALSRCGLLDEVTLGFVPLGTANDLATHLGMADDPGAAADQLTEGHQRRLDLLRLRSSTTECELVVNAVHAGLGIAAAQRATSLKPVLGRVAYPVGVLLAGVACSGRAVAVRVDGEPIDLDGPILAVAVANAPRLGGVDFVPDADPGDGVLDVLAVPARPWWARGSAIAHLAGRPARQVWSGRGRVVELEGEIGPMDADGEHLGVGDSCTVDVLPAALTVRAPASGHDAP